MKMISSFLRNSQVVHSIRRKKMYSLGKEGRGGERGGFTRGTNKKERGEGQEGAMLSLSLNSNELYLRKKYNSNS